MALEEAGIEIAWGHDPAHVNLPAGQPPERLAVTKALTAVNPDHPELAAARGLGIPVEPWQQVVADVAATSRQRLVAVAGTHGKSTTTGWLVDVLVRADRDPSAFVGALLDATLTGGTPSTARWGRGDVLVVEADEYAGNFDPYRSSCCSTRSGITPTCSPTRTRSTTRSPPGSAPPERRRSSRMSPIPVCAKCWSV
jgi:UDP-N-acetylmuramate-alanine ligase